MLLHTLSTTLTLFISLLIHTARAAPSSHQPVCVPAPVLPPVRDCNVITALLQIASLKAGEGAWKRWGTNLPDTATTAKLPKVYYAGRYGPDRRLVQCTLTLEQVDRPDLPDYDYFNLKSVVRVANAIVNRCLRTGQVGYDFPGEFFTVQAELSDYQGPPILSSLSAVNGSNISQQWDLTYENETYTLFEGDVLPSQSSKPTSLPQVS